MEVASNCTCIVADPGDTYIFADVIFGSPASSSAALLAAWGLASRAMTERSSIYSSSSRPCIRFAKQSTTAESISNNGGILGRGGSTRSRLYSTQQSQPHLQMQRWLALPAIYEKWWDFKRPLVMSANSKDQIVVVSDFGFDHLYILLGSTETYNYHWSYILVLVQWCVCVWDACRNVAGYYIAQN